MAIIGRNLVPTPRFTATDRGAWEAGTVSEHASAGLDGEPSLRLVGASSITALAVPILGEVWTPGHAYFITARVMVSATTDVLLALGPEGGRDFASYALPSGYLGKSHTVVLQKASASSWRTVTETLVLDPDASFEDEMGNEIPYVGSDLYLYVVPVTSGRGNQASISHVRLDYIENTYGTAYFDGDSDAADDTVFAWNGTPYLSPSTAVLTEVEPDPDPTDPDPTDPEPTDPEPTDPDPTDPDPTDPDPDPHPDADPWDVYEALAERLAPRAAAFTGRGQDPATIATARAQLPVVIEYVRGYTRGRGFSEAGLPVSPLRAVIVSAVARLVVNPEQLTYYSVGDYSERPAVLSGWTLAELGVLRRYRRTAA